MMNFSNISLGRANMEAKNMETRRLVRQCVFSIVLASSLILVVGCGKQAIGVSQPSEPLSNNPPKKNIDQSQQSPYEKPLLLISGGSNIVGQNIYTLSSNANEAIPTRFGDYRMEYFDPIPFSGNDQRGRAVAVSKEPYGPDYGIRLLNFKTGQSYALYESTLALSDVVLSPDSAWLAFTEETNERTKDGRSGVSVKRVKLLEVSSARIFEIPLSADVNPASKAAVSYSDTNPTFSPDGEYLTFERRKDGQSAIMWLAFSTKQIGVPSPFIAYRGDGDASSLRFSNDRGTYTYLLRSGKSTKLVVRISEQTERGITEKEESAYEPSWSVDGRKLVYWTNSRDAQTLKIFDISSNQIKSLATFNAPSEGPKNKVCPAWSPDMQEIYFAGRAGYWSAIFKVSVTNGELKKLTDTNIPPSFYCPRVMSNYEVNQ